MTYFVYMLETERGTIYTGITTDVQRRYKEHLEGSHKKNMSCSNDKNADSSKSKGLTGGKGAKYTNANKPVKILYTKEYETKSEAMKEEYRIKRLTRAKKLEMINSN